MKRFFLILLISSALASCKADDGIIDVLVFGHSFGVDCTNYLPELACEAGVNNLHVGRFIRSNCSLQEHWAFCQADSTVFYSEVQPGERKFPKKQMSVKEAIESTAWDYVIFQNSLENEGRYDTAQPYLDSLISFISRTSIQIHGKKPVFGWNMFWPISKLMEDGHDARAAYRLSFYENSSLKAWEAYQATARMVLDSTEVSFVIPSGAAVMAARGSSLNTPEANEFTRDGYHMSYGGGRYLAACVWFEALLRPLTGKTVVGNTLRATKTPVPVTDDATALALQRLAEDAVASGFAPLR